MNYSTIRKLIIATVTAGSLAVAVSSPASAGFLGDLINNVAPGLGTQLDRWNAQNGNVVDHVAAGIAEAIVPGAGEVMEGYYAYNRGGIGGLVTHELGGGTTDDQPEIGSLAAPSVDLPEILSDPAGVINDQINSAIQQLLPDPNEFIND